MKKKQYNTCIFDLYGTLVDIHTDENKNEVWEKLSYFYKFYGADYKPLELKQSYETIVAEMSKGVQQLRKDSHEAYPEIQIEQVFEQLFKEKNVLVNNEMAIHVAQFFRILSTDYIKLYDGTIEMLEAIKKSGKNIYLLSNAQRVFTQYEMNALGITKYFDGIFISSDYNCKKPDERFFKELLKEYSIIPEDAIMIGNDGICDILGAKKVGLSTLYVHSNLSPKEEDVKADIVLSSMDMEKMTECLLENGIDE